MIGRPFAAIICLILQIISLIGSSWIWWLIAVIWSVYALNQYKTYKKIEEALNQYEIDRESTESFNK